MNISIRLAIGFLYIIFFGGVLYYRRRFLKKRLDLLSPVISGTIKGKHTLEGKLEGNWNNKKVELSFSKITVISLYYDFGFYLTIAHKGWWNIRLTRKWKIVDTHDSLFSKEYYVVAYDESKARHFLTPAKREIIQRLFKIKFRNKFSKNKGLWINPNSINFNISELRISADEFREAIEYMDELTA